MKLVLCSTAAAVFGAVAGATVTAPYTNSVGYKIGYHEATQDVENCPDDWKKADKTWQRHWAEPEQDVDEVNRLVWEADRVKAKSCGELQKYGFSLDDNYLFE